MADGALDGMIVSLHCKTAADLVLDVGENKVLGQQRLNAEKSLQRFKLVMVYKTNYTDKNGHLYHIISEKDENEALDLASGSREAGTEIVMSTFQGGPTQQWFLEESFDGGWMIRSKGKGNLVITAPEEEGRNMIISKKQHTENQQFYIQLVGHV